MTVNEAYGGSRSEGDSQHVARSDRWVFCGGEEVGARKKRGNSHDILREQISR